MSTPPPAEEDPLEDGRQDAASPIAAELSPPDETPTDPYLSLMKEIVDTHKEMRKAYLKHLISITQNHNLLIEDSIRLRQELTEINRRVQILQDWMMSPFRLVPLQALQDNSLNINDIQAIASETLSADNPCQFNYLNCCIIVLQTIFHILKFQPGIYYIRKFHLQVRRKMAQRILRQLQRNIQTRFLKNLFLLLLKLFLVYLL